MQADMGKLEAFQGKMIGDMGAAISAALVLIGDKLGLYKTLTEIGPDPRRAGSGQRRGRTLRPRVARGAGRGGLRRIRPDQRPFLHEPRAIDGLR
jgi:hypothetical protein